MARLLINVRKVCAFHMTRLRLVLATGMDTCMLLSVACGVGCCVVRGGRCAV